MKTETRLKAKEAADGVLDSLANVGLVLVCMMFTGCLIHGGCSIGVDDTDKSGWKRSGLRLHIDNRTGVNYLSDGHGGLCIRVTETGEPIIDKH